MLPAAIAQCGLGCIFVLWGCWAGITGQAFVIKFFNHRQKEETINKYQNCISLFWNQWISASSQICTKSYFCFITLWHLCFYSKYLSFQIIFENVLFNIFARDPLQWGGGYHRARGEVHRGQIANLMEGFEVFLLDDNGTTFIMRFLFSLF